MGSTVRHPAPRKYYSPVTAVGTYLHAHHPELTARSWDQLIRGRNSTPARFAAIIEAATATGDHKLVGRLMAPVDAALSGAPIPPFGAAVVLMAQRSDMDEDLAEAQYHADPTTDTLRAWLRAIDAQGAAHRVLRTSIATHLENA